MNILIKFATRGRRDHFKSRIQNIFDTISHNHTICIEVTCDHDDETMRPGHDFNFGDRVNITYGLSQTKIEAINRDMVEITKRYNWDILVNMSDDMEFVVQGWDQRIVNDLTALGGSDWFIHYNDGYVFDKLPTMSIMGREYYNRFFYIYPPCYKSFSCDAEAMFVAQMLGRWYYSSDILFKHLHPSNCRTPLRGDETYNRANKHTNDDITTYFGRMKRLFYVNNPVTIPDLLRNELINQNWQHLIP